MASMQVSAKHAAVLVPLFEDRDGVVRVLLTQRSSAMKSHPGLLLDDSNMTPAAVISKTPP